MGVNQADSMAVEEQRNRNSFSDILLNMSSLVINALLIPAARLLALQLHPFKIRMEVCISISIYMQILVFAGTRKHAQICLQPES